jgi:hypothetical protein
MKQGQQEYDKLCNENWVLLLKIFHKVNGSDEQRKEQYNALKDLSKTKTLSPRQSEGITGRCDYRIHLIDNPNEEPFSNMEKPEKRINLSKEQSNGKP